MGAGVNYMTLQPAVLGFGLLPVAEYFYACHTVQAFCPKAGICGVLPSDSSWPRLLIKLLHHIHPVAYTLCLLSVLRDVCSTCQLTLAVLGRGFLDDSSRQWCVSYRSWIFLRQPLFILHLRCLANAGITCHCEETCCWPTCVVSVITHTIHWIESKDLRQISGLDTLGTLLERLRKTHRWTIY